MSACSRAEGLRGVSVRSWLARKETPQTTLGPSRHLRRSARKAGSPCRLLTWFSFLLSRNGRKDLALGRSLGCLIVRLVERATERRGDVRGSHGWVYSEKPFPGPVLARGAGSGRGEAQISAAGAGFSAGPGNSRVLPPRSFIFGGRCN